MNCLLFVWAIEIKLWLGTEFAFASCLGLFFATDGWFFVVLAFSDLSQRACLLTGALEAAEGTVD